MEAPARRLLVNADVRGRDQRRAPPAGGGHGRLTARHVYRSADLDERMMAAQM